MDAKHTPGPWSIGTAKFDRENGSALQGEVTRLFMPGAIEVLVVSLGASQEQVKADARLIAAAPELLDFVKEWLTRQGTDENYMTAKAKSAIYKSTGKES